MNNSRIPVVVDKDLEDLIPQFLARRHTEVEMLREALAAANYDQLKLSGHSMKGTGGGYGFDGISEIGADLEVAAAAADVSGIATAIDKLVDYLERIDIVYE